MHWLRGRINRISSVLTRGIFPHEFSWVIDNPVRRLFVSPEQLVNRLPLPECSRLLEIGPGSGYFSVELGRRAGTGRLELFDVQVEMLAKARRKLEARALFNVGYVQGDASISLPYREGVFDLVVMVTVLGEVADNIACLESIRRVLRPGGFLAVHEHLPDPDFVEFRRLKWLLEGRGFALRHKWGRWWNYTVLFSS